MSVELEVETVEFGGDQQAIGPANLRPAQLALIVAAVVPPYVAMMAHRTLVAAILLVWTVAVGMVAVIRIPAKRRYVDQILGPWLRRRWWLLFGSKTRLPVTGRIQTSGELVQMAPQAPPAEVRELELARYLDPAGREFGIVYDRLAHTYAAVLRIELAGAGLGGTNNLSRTLRTWESALEGLAEHVRPRRFQWLLVGSPDDGTRLQADFDERAVRKDSDEGLMLQRLIERAGPRNTQHETYIVVQVDEAKGSDYEHVEGNVTTASCAAAVKAAADTAALLTASYRVTSAGLSPDELGRLVHLLYVPSDRPIVSKQGDRVSPEQAWPRHTSGLRHADRYEVDGVVHRAFELQPPTRAVFAAYLDSMVALPGTAYAVSFVYQPLDRSMEIDKGERRRGAAEAADKTRTRWQFLKSRKAERREESNETFIDQLDHGAHPFRVTSWAAVSAFPMPVDRDDTTNYMLKNGEAIFAPGRAVERRLAAAQSALSRAATAAKTPLLPRSNVHAQALSHVGPFCRGTEGRWA